MADIEKIIIRPDGIVVGLMRETSRGKATSVAHAWGTRVRAEGRYGNAADNHSDSEESPIKSCGWTLVIMNERLPRIDMTKYKTMIDWLMSPENLSQRI